LRAHAFSSLSSHSGSAANRWASVGGFPPCGGSWRRAARCNARPCTLRFRLVFEDSIANELFAIWRADLANAGGPVLDNRKLVSTQFGDLDAQPSPDGSQIVWMSLRTGSAEIRASDAMGETPLQLTHLGRYSGTPRRSQDGKWIAFDSYKSQAPQIFIVDSAGRNHSRAHSAWASSAERTS
jgi:Tol biopolymer transport system component